MWMKLFPLCGALLFGAVAAGVALAQNTKLAADLAKVFDAHHAAVQAKDIDKALALRSSAFRHNRGFEGKPDAMTRQMYLAYVARVTPESYVVEYAALESDNQKATLGIVASLPDDGVVKSRILNFAFAKEGGTWKMGQHEFWMVDVDGLTHPKSTTFEPKSAYSEVSSKSGRIVKTTFHAGHTLVMLRDNDQESAVFLPAKDGLAELKLKPEDLEPGNKAQFAGLTQAGDPLKMWATGGERLVGF